MSVSAALALAISAIGVGVGLATLAKAYGEYVLRGNQLRAELFFSLRRRLKEEDLSRIADLIERAATPESAEDAKQAREELAKTDLRHKRDYVGLFEEVALFVQSGQIDLEVAHYMFGYYALMCDEYPPFWNNINHDSPYWFVFRQFCDEMRVLRDELAKRVKDLEVLPG